MIASRDQIVAEANSLLNRYDSKVRAFNLSLVEGGVAQHQGTWIIPLASGVTTGSATELSDLLRTMRRDMESKFKEPVSVMLDPDDQ